MNGTELIVQERGQPREGPDPGISEILTIEEAAKVLRCSKAHLAKLLNGQVPGVPNLPHLRLGRRKLIRRSMLYQWMAEVEQAQGGMLSALPEIRAV